MIQQLVDHIQSMFAENQFFSGGMLLAAIGFIIAYLRVLPVQIYHFLRRKLIIHIEILDTSDIYKWFSVWLALHKLGKTTRILTAVTGDEVNQSISAVASMFDDDDADSDTYEAMATSIVINEQGNPMFDRESKHRITLIPGIGFHWLIYKWRLVFVYRSRRETNASNDNKSFREVFDVVILSRNRAIANSLMEEVKRCGTPKNGMRYKVRIPTRYDGYWSTSGARKLRPAHTVIMRRGLIEDLLADARRFITEEHWYDSIGLPYHRGYLFYGPPGNGKSSLVSMLASELGMDVGSFQMPSSDTALFNLMTSLPVNTILLMEDIDTHFVKREKVDKIASAMSFSALLNALDGAVAVDRRIVVMTTNHIEQIDPALIRPGRIDRIFEIKNADQDQAYRLYLKFYPKKEVAARRFADSVEPGVYSMATLQGHLLRYYNTPIDELLTKSIEILASDINVDNYSNNSQSDAVSNGFTVEEPLFAKSGD